jgi:hypothetical protein
MIAFEAPGPSAPAFTIRLEKIDLGPGESHATLTGNLGDVKPRPRWRKERNGGRAFPPLGVLEKGMGMDLMFR